MTFLFQKIRSLLIWSQQYTKTDMMYLAKGGFWQLVGQFIAAIGAFLFSIIVANYISPYLYGSYKYVLSLVSIIGAFSLSGLGTTIVRKVAQGDETSLKRGFARSLLWSLPMFLGFCAISGYYVYQGDFVLSTAIFVAGLATPFINATSLFNAYWNGKKDFQRQAIYWGASYVFPTLFVIVAFFFTDNIAILISIFFVTTAIANGYLYLRTIKKITPAPNQRDPLEEKDAFHQSIINFLNNLSSNIDKIIVFHFLGTVQLAIYSFALAMPEQIRNAFRSVSRVSLPRFAEQPFENIQKNIGQKIVRFSFIALLLAVIYILLAPLLFTYLFPAYVSSIPYSQIIALSLLGVLGVAPVSALQAHAKHRALYIHAIVSNIFQIVSTVALVISFGLWGAVIALLINRLFALILPWFLLKKSNEPV